MFSVRSLAGVLAACVVAFACAADAARAPVSPEPYFRHADFDDLQLSPSGTLLAAIAPVNGRRALVAMDLATRKPRVITTDRRPRHPRRFQWVNDKRLVFDVWDLQSSAGRAARRRPFRASMSTASDFRVLAPTIKSLRDRSQCVYRYTRFARVLYDGSDDVLVLSNERSELWADMYRLNTRERTEDAC